MTGEWKCRGGQRAALCGSVDRTLTSGWMTTCMCARGLLSVRWSFGDRQEAARLALLTLSHSGVELHGALIF